VARARALAVARAARRWAGPRPHRTQGGAGTAGGGVERRRQRAPGLRRVCGLQKPRIRPQFGSGRHAPGPGRQAVTRPHAVPAADSGRGGLGRGDGRGDGAVKVSWSAGLGGLLADLSGEGREVGVQ
jgi:hypothetical protein